VTAPSQRIGVRSPEPRDRVLELWRSRAFPRLEGTARIPIVASEATKQPLFRPFAA